MSPFIRRATGIPAAAALSASALSISLLAPTATAAPAPTSSGGSQSTPTGSTLAARPGYVSLNRNLALRMVLNRGWSRAQFVCLDKLWRKESGWNHKAANRYSGAYGIPQALPGRKMRSAGSDWKTNPATQISWGLGYIKSRYGTPCKAWSHSKNRGWY